MTLIGMDTDLVHSIAGEIHAKATATISLTSTANRLIRSVERIWHGTRADRWLTDWFLQEMAVRKVSADLELLARKLKEEADEQDRASRAPAPLQPGFRRVPAGIGLGDGDLDETQVQQGSFGDCWFIACLGAVAGRFPSAIRDGIKRYPDGTYSVTLYKKITHPFGPPTFEKIEVDVDQVEENGAKNPDRTPNFASLYERALEVYKGNLGGGGIDEGLELITGREARKQFDPSMPSLSEIERGLSEGRVYTAATVDHGTNELAKQHNLGPTFNPFDKEVTHPKICPNHAYMVDEVAERQGVKMIHVVNPWGPNAQSDSGDSWGDVWLTEDEFKSNFQGVASVSTN